MTHRRPGSARRRRKRLEPLALEAANKTEALIQQSVKEAVEGETTARHVNEQLGAIIASVSKVGDIVAEMAASAKEQATGIEQVTKAVAQVGIVTQQNAANSEESSSAAAELSGQAEELAAMVGSFRLEAGATAARRAAPAPARAKHAAPARARASAAQPGIPLRPEELIPMEGDARFEEF